MLRLKRKTTERLTFGFAIGILRMARHNQKQRIIRNNNVLQDVYVLQDVNVFLCSETKGILLFDFLICFISLNFLL